MTKNITENKTGKELSKILKEAEETLYQLAGKISELRDAHEVPHVSAEIAKLVKEGKVKNITTAWIQGRYKYGYARSARLMDALRAKKVIK